MKDCGAFGQVGISEVLELFVSQYWCVVMMTWGMLRASSFNQLNWAILS